MAPTVNEAEVPAWQPATLGDARRGVLALLQLAQALGRHSPALRYADPVVYFALPDAPGVGSRMTLESLQAQLAP